MPVTRAQLETRFGKDAIVKWVDIDSHYATDRVTDASIYADEFVAGALHGKRYDPNNALIAQLKVDLAGHRLYAIRGMGDEDESKAMKVIFDSVVETLSLISKGRIYVGNPKKASNTPSVC